MNKPRYINANELKDTLDYYISEAGWTADHNEALTWVRDEFIDAVKTADAAPVVHGRWIKVKHPYGNVNWHKKCSICDKCIDWQDYQYCPACGAKMDEEEEK